eukprot:CAMPEP_0113944490 /NCGR_PEP_ID=MMETSP1339-20121228/34455_1 /TAXON_ID=94617 /ORGANISM="Fibrocapsa japonica" /LENGTH=396 /DNA_ID=CAMNT_0000949709 /DNA_START=94 /DNA_END=1284 /DNA_ORIENTATION=+ /assembly_acc=CAM_ASM_000762
MKLLLFLAGICSIVQFGSCDNECSLPQGNPCVTLYYDSPNSQGFYYDSVCASSGGFGCDITHHGCKKCTLDVDCPACVKEYHTTGSLGTTSTTEAPAATTTTTTTTTTDLCASLATDACIQDTSNIYMARGIGMYNSGDCTAEDDLCDATFTSCRLCVFDPSLYAENCEEGPDGGACGAADLPACPACVTEEFFTKLGHVPTDTSAGTEDAEEPADAAQSEMVEGGGGALSSDACEMPAESPCVHKLAKTDHERGLMLIFDGACETGVPGCHAYAAYCRLCVADEDTSEDTSFIACPPCGVEAYGQYYQAPPSAKETTQTREYSDDLNDKTSWWRIVLIAVGVCSGLAFTVGLVYSVFYRRSLLKHAYEQVHRSNDPYAEGDEDDIEPLELETSNI